jgi:hypothetical protein
MPLPALLPLLLAGGGGALLGGLFAKGGGQAARSEPVPTRAPNQISGQNQVLQQALSGLGGLNKPFDFGPIEKQARSGFAQQTVPTLAERFTSMGNNALSSPAFASQLGQAGAGLEENLAALKSQIGLQQQGQQQNLLLNLLQTGLAPQSENLIHPQQPGFGESAANAGIQALLAYLAGGLPGLGFGLAGQFGQLGSQQPQQQPQKTGLGGTPVYNTRQGFADPSLYGSGLQNLMRGF